MTGILKVDTIQSSGGTTAMTIDSSGRPLAANGKVPCFHVSRVDPRQTITQNTAATVAFNANDFLHGWTLANTGVLTCGSGAGGIYSITFRCRINSGTDGNWYGRILKNDASLAAEYMQNEYFEYCNIAILAAIAAGDTVHAVVYQNIAAINDTIGGTDIGPNCHMYAHRISA